MQRVLLKINNLSKTFGEIEVFKNVNLEIYEKEVLGVLGLSGSGKTTLLNLLCGFIKPSYGDIQHYDENYEEEYVSIFLHNAQIKSLIGFSSQSESYYPELTVKDNLLYFGTLENIKKNEIESEINRILKTLELGEAEEILGENLSGGMKKRLDIACALISKPKILILDEPTSNLDFKLRKDILNLIKKISSTGVTVIFVSHYIDEISAVSDRVAIVHNKNVTIDTKSDLQKKFTKTLQKDGEIITNI